MNICTRSATCLAILALSVLPARAQAPDESVATDLREYASRLEKLGFSGVIAVAQGNETFLAEGYGLANRETSTPWTTGTVSTLGSLTKQFTGAAILALVEDGRLGVDDTLVEHFADVPADKQAITVHQLLTHSSGIVDLKGAGDWDPIERESFVRRILAQELEFEPGTDYDYSNAGYSLLAAIIEQLTGDRYEAFVRTRFFDPLGMESTGYVIPEFADSNLAQGYGTDGHWGTVLERPMAEDGPYWVLRGNGGIHSTAQDMLIWGRALLNGEVLSPASMEQYWSPHVDEGGGESFYGYGWVVIPMADQVMITHDGGNRIFFANMALVPGPDFIVFLMTNAVQEFPLAQEILEPLMMRVAFGQPLPELPDLAEEPPADLSELAGHYEFNDGGEFSVRLENDVLQLEALDTAGFAALFSTRPVDMGRAARFTALIDEVAAAYVEHDDLRPLFEAYGKRAPLERLENGWMDRKAELESEYGALTGHRVLGTAFRDGRDVTALRLEFENGHADRAYVWDPGSDAELLGISLRGLDPVLHVHAVVGGSFASWDARSGATVPVGFIRSADSGMEMILGPDGRRLARRTGEGG